jgi:hypothetical protein
MQPTEKTSLKRVIRHNLQQFLDVIRSCQKSAWTQGSFLRDSHNCGCLPVGKHQIVDMRHHASGGRDTARVRHIRTDTVHNALRKKAIALESVNPALRRTRNLANMVMDVERVGDAERDAMGSVVRKKHEPRWVWHASDHCTGAVFA